MLSKTTLLKHYGYPRPKYHSQILNIDAYLTSIKNIGDDIQTKTNNIVDMSYDTSLNKLIELAKVTETKIKNEGLNGIDFSVSMNVGPISVVINKKIE
jgi:hypothetical protein